MIIRTETDAMEVCDKMLKRLLTAFLGLIVFFGVLPAPSGVFSVAVLIITLMAVFEIHKAITGNKILIFIGLLMAAAVFTGTVTNHMLFGIMSAFVVYLLLTVIMFGKEKVQDIYMLGFATIVYSGFFSTLALIKSEFGVYAVLLPFLFAWITDTGAYFTGITIGKHKLIPKLSPKKTVEGAIGGVVLCVICSLAYVYVLETVFSQTLMEGNNYIKMMPLSLIASVVSQLGDFVSSAIKREFNVKDFGNILPGHGGVMDRFDSIIFVSPLVYYLLTII